MRLHDKVAIVSGSGSGFGEAIARRYAEEGAKVIVNDINADGGNRVAEAIHTAGGIAAFIRADVVTNSGWAAIIAAAQTHYGRIDIVVNNAGWTHRNKPFMEVTEAEFDKVYAVN